MSLIARLPITLLFIFSLFSLNLFAQTEIPKLEAGKPLEREMSGGETHNYRVSLTSGQFLKLTVDQKLIDVVVVAFTPDGKKIVEIDFNGNRGIEPVFLIAETAGDYHLEVQSLQKSVPAGKYEIKIVALYTSTQKDVSNAAAMKLVAEAKLLEKQVERKVDNNFRETLRKAIAKYEEALPFFRGAENWDGELSTLFDIGFVYKNIGNFAQAINTWEQVLILSEKRGSLRDVARGQYNIGNTYRQMGNYTKAIEMFQKSYLQSEKIGARDGMRSALFGLGGVYQSELGDFNLALDFYKRALAFTEEQSSTSFLVPLYSGIGLTYSFQGNYAKALEYMQKALALAEQLGDEPNARSLLVNIGLAHGYLGNYDLALEYFQKSFRKFEESGRRNGMAIALINMGEIYGNQGKYEDAIKNLQKALKLTNSKETTANSLNTIGRVYRQQADYERALEFLNRALEIQKDLQNKANFSKTLNEIAQVHILKSNYAQALDFSEQSISISENNGDLETLWQAKQSIGEAYVGLKEPVKAQQAFNEVISIIEKLRLRVGGEQSQEIFFNSKMSPFYEMVKLEIAQNNFAQAFAYAERSKSRSLLDVLQNGKIVFNKAMTAREQEQERLFKTELVSLNAQISKEKERQEPDKSRLADLQNQLDKKRLEFEDFQTRLYAAHPELKVQRGEIKPISLAESAGLLTDNKSALLEYVVADDKTFLFVLTKDASQKIALRIYPIEIKQKNLAEQTESFREKLAKGDLDFQKQARDLYDLLVKPAEAQLKNKTNLIIVPDSALWDLPFQALQTTPNKYLIETAAVSYAPSLTALREMAKKNQDKQFAGATLLGFGNPIVGKETSAKVKQVFMSEKLEPLPEAERLVTSLGKLYGANKSKIFIGAEALEATAKTETPKFQIVQFATHGILNDINPMYSHIVLAQKENNSTEDGLLEAWEMKDLNLRADMVILSACETARGRVSGGEGVIGMSWALFIAGAPTTVASQWKVESSSTTELMLEFHRQLLTVKNITKAEALRRASLKLMKSAQYKHPSYWAGFVMVGDGF